MVLGVHHKNGQLSGWFPVGRQNNPWHSLSTITIVTIITVAAL